MARGKKSKGALRTVEVDLGHWVKTKNLRRGRPKRDLTRIRMYPLVGDSRVGIRHGDEDNAAGPSKAQPIASDDLDGDVYDGNSDVDYDFGSDTESDREALPKPKRKRERRVVSLRL